MGNTGLIFIIGATAAALCSPALSQCRVVELQAPSGYGAFPYGLSPSGRVGGSVARLTDTENRPLPAIWDVNGQVQLLPLGPTAEQGEVTALNDVGVRVGRLRSAQGTQAVKWSGGDPVALGPLQAYNTSATSINRKGLVGGTVSEDMVTTSPTVWSKKGELFYLPKISDRPAYVAHVNERGEAFGSSHDESGRARAVRWDQRGRLTILNKDGGRIASANGANEQGDVVGTVFRLVDQVTRGKPVRWRSDVQSDLPMLGGTSGAARSINNAGVVVGSASLKNEALIEVAWRGDQLIDLGARLPADFTGAGKYLAQALKINDLGHILALARQNLPDQTYRQFGIVLTGCLD